MGENLTKQYKGYAKYLPSLQMNYTRFAAGGEEQITRDNYTLPNGFKVSDLNFLSKKSNLWHCKYALYSGGQFTDQMIRTPDIVALRNPDETVILGDSGGFQLGTGEIKNADDRAFFDRFAKDKAKMVEHWDECGMRERILRWLDSYSTYGVTLDMVLWGSENPNSPLHNMTTEQLIDMTVDNLKFFQINRKTFGQHTKFLNVLQGNTEADPNAEEKWYQAVKDFDFEGWSMVGNGDKTAPSIRRFKRLLDDGKLVNSEWIHVLKKSPPFNSVVYTAVQRVLRDELGSNITVSFDSSSPHQMAGKQRSFALMPDLETSVFKDWKIRSVRVSDDYRVATGQIASDFDFETPLSKFFQMKDVFGHQRKHADSFVDSFSEHLMVNHNIYTYHKAAIASCDLMFHPTKKDPDKAPDKVRDSVKIIEDYLRSDSPGNLDDELTEVLDGR